MSAFDILGKPVLSADEASASPLLLPLGFKPSCWHVICERGREPYQHVGNRRFRQHVQDVIDSYVATSSRREKTCIIRSIMDRVRHNSAAPDSPQDTGFVKMGLLKGRWEVVPEGIVKQKCGQALRDARKTNRTTADAETDKNTPERRKRKADDEIPKSSNRCVPERKRGQQQTLIEKTGESFIEQEYLLQIEPAPIRSISSVLPASMLTNSTGYDEISEPRNHQLTARRDWMAILESSAYLDANCDPLPLDASEYDFSRIFNDYQS